MLNTSILAPNLELVERHTAEGSPWPSLGVLVDEALRMLWSVLDGTSATPEQVRAYAERRRLERQGHPQRRLNTKRLKTRISADNDERLRRAAGDRKAWPSAGELVDDALDLFWDYVDRHAELRATYLAGTARAIEGLTDSSQPAAEEATKPRARSR